MCVWKGISKRICYDFMKMFFFPNRKENSKLTQISVKLFSIHARKVDILCAKQNF